MNRNVVEVSDVGLAYRLSRNRATSFKEFAIQAVKRQVSHEELWALRGVSFAVERGETFGVVGPNGAGKSSLMKIVARVFPPTEGRIVVRGDVAPMIELGAGFNPELTAYENIVLYGTLLGREPQFMRERARAILEWADLLEFADVPTRSFSTGMLARLGFAVATDVQCDLLVVDEVLSVGDEQFQVKSKERIEHLMESGTSVLLVSHNLKTVAELAERALWLDKGLPKLLESAEDVVSAYKEWSDSGQAGA